MFFKTKTIYAGGGEKLMLRIITVQAITQRGKPAELTLPVRFFQLKYINLKRKGLYGIDCRFKITNCRLGIIDNSQFVIPSS